MEPSQTPFGGIKSSTYPRLLGQGLPPAFRRNVSGREGWDRNFNFISPGTTASRAKVHPSGPTDFYLRGSPIFRRYRAVTLSGTWRRGRSNGSAILFQLAPTQFGRTLDRDLGAAP